MSKLSKFFKVIAATGDQPVIVQIRGLIGDSFDDATWTIKNTGDEVRSQLASYAIGTKIKVLVDTEGGSMQCALGIRNAFDERAEDLTFYNCGYMASSGAILPPTKSKVICPDASFVMIHKPYSDVYAANDDDLESALAALRAHNDVYAGIIADRIGKTKDEVLALMKATTWWTGEQARAIGYGCAPEADEEIEEITARVPQIFARYKNVPEQLQKKITAAMQPPTKPQPTQEKSMKMIIAALVAHGISVAADASEETILAQINPVLAENKRLKEDNQKHLDARKSRIAALLDTAVTDTIITDARKTSLLALGTSSAEGETEVIAQIGELRTAKAVKAPRGAAPAKFVAANATAEEVQARIEELQCVIHDSKLSPAVRAAATRESIDLRGYGKLVKPVETVTAGRN